MASLVCTACDGEGIVGRGRWAERCGLCEDGYRLCIRCNHDRAQLEHHLDGEGHVCDDCATRYYERQPLESLTDEQLAFLEYTPAEIRAIRRKAEPLSASECHSTITVGPTTFRGPLSGACLAVSPEAGLALWRTREWTYEERRADGWLVATFPSGCPDPKAWVENVTPRKAVAA